MATLTSSNTWVLLLESVEPCRAAVYPEIGLIIVHRSGERCETGLHDQVGFAHPLCTMLTYCLYVYNDKTNGKNWSRLDALHLTVTLSLQYA